MNVVFGKTDIGLTPAAVSADYKQVTAYVNPHNMYAQKMSLYVDHVVSTNSQAVRGVIYTDLAGEPDALVARTQEVVVAAIAENWVDFPFVAPIPLTIRKYWIGLHAGGPNDGAVWMVIDNVASSRKYNLDVYADGTTDPFGTPDATDTYQFSLYVEGIGIPASSLLQSRSMVRRI